MSKGFKKLIILLIPLAIAISFALYIRKKIEIIVRPLIPIAVAQLSEHLGREIKVGEVKVDLAGNIVLNNLIIAREKELAEGTLLEAKKILVRCNPKELLSGKKARAIKVIKLEDAYIYVCRDEKGNFNWAELFKKMEPAPPEERFTGSVIVHSGKAEIVDELLEADRNLVIENMEGKADFSPLGYINLNLEGENRQGKFTRCKLAGKVRLAAADFNLNLAIRDIQAIYLRRYFLQKNYFLAGKLDLVGNVATSKGIPRKISYDISAKVKEAAINLRADFPPLTGINGKLRAFNDNLELDLREARLKGSLFVVKGLISNFKSPRLDLQISSPKVNYRQIAPLLNLPSIELKDLRVRFTIAGKARQPNVMGELEAREMRIFKSRAERAWAEFRYSDGIAKIMKAKAQVGAGKIMARGEVKPGSEEWVFAGKFENIEAREAHRYLNSTKWRLKRGMASGDFQLKAKGKEFDLSSKVKIANLRVNQWSFQVIETVARLDQGKITFNLLEIEDEKGYLLAWGNLPFKTGAQLKLVAKDVNVAQFSEFFNLKNLSGWANFAGKMEGDIREPEFTGTLELRDVKVSKRSLPSLRAQLTADLKQAKITSGEVEIDKQRYLFSGTISNSNRNPYLDLKISSRGTSLKKLMALLEKEFNATGTCNFNVLLKGTPKELQVSGEADVTEGAIKGKRIERTKISFDYANQVIEIKNLQAYINKSFAQAQGTIDLETETLQANFQATEVLVEEFKEFLPTELALNLKGKINCKGSLKGKIKKPLLVAAVDSPRISLNQEEFDNIAGEVRYQTEKLQFSPLKFSCAQGQFELNGEIWTSGKFISLDAKIDQAEISRLLRLISANLHILADEEKENIAKKLRQPIAGKLTATAKFLGKWNNPRIYGVLKISQSSFWDYQIAQISSYFFVENKEVEIRTLEAKEMETTITARGKADFKGSLSVKAEAQNLDISQLKDLLNLERDLKGYVNTKIELGGSTRSPKLVCLLEGKDIGMGKLKFDRVSSEKIEFNADSLELKDLILTKGKYQLTIEGRLPFSWKPFGVPKEKEIDVQAQVKDQSLEIVRLFVGEVAKAEGKISSQLHIGGSVIKPDFQGFLTLSDGKVLVKGMENAFQNISAKISLYNNKVSVERLVGYSGKGHFTLSGNLTLTQYSSKEFYRNQFDFTFSTANLFIKCPKLFEGSINSQFRISPRDKKKLTRDSFVKMAGYVEISDAKISLPEKDALKRPLKLPKQPEIESTVEMGKNVWFTTATMRCLTKGSAKIAGTPRELALYGNFFSDRGTMYYASSRFKLIKGDVEFTKAPSAPQITANLYAKAQTTMGKHQIFLEIGPGRVSKERLPTVNLFSIPPVAKSEIYGLLAHQENVDKILQGKDIDTVIAQEASALLATSLEAQVIEPFQRILEESFGLEELAIEYALEEPVQIRLGRNLVDEIYIIYSRWMAEPRVRYVLKVEYRAKEQTIFSWSIDENRRTIIEIQSGFRF